MKSIIKIKIENWKKWNKVEKEFKFEQEFSYWILQSNEITNLNFNFVLNIKEFNMKKFNIEKFRNW